MYHSILEMHEEDRVFIDREGVILEREQIDILRRISHLNPWIKRFGLGFGSLAFIDGIPLDISRTIRPNGHVVLGH